MFFMVLLYVIEGTSVQDDAGILQFRRPNFSSNIFRRIITSLVDEARRHDMDVHVMNFQQLFCVLGFLAHVSVAKVSFHSVFSMIQPAEHPRP